MFLFKQTALIAPTASGKTPFAIEYAHKYNANILSLDSLAIYKEMDIVSAKPTLKERGEIQHFGIDEIYPNEHFDVTIFIKLYKRAREKSIQEEKSLIIVGGTSFYLKVLLSGISPMPSISQESYQKTLKLCEKIKEAYTFLYNRDREYMKKIAPTDKYRVEKMLNLFFETGLTPTEYFRANPPKPIITEPLNIYEIVTNRAILKERIIKRTEQMLNRGLIDEVAYLEKRYGRIPNAMRAIGVKEVLDYFDGIYTKEELREKIIINTAKLAKRQRTFNSSQFPNRVSISLNKLKERIL
jgi:tRNA dimethylallyltransferase